VECGYQGLGRVENRKLLFNGCKVSVMQGVKLLKICCKHCAEVNTAIQTHEIFVKIVFLMISVPITK
jgi:hypothetical protein